EGGSLWGHDLFAAIASRAVAGRARSALDADLAFTGGLLHDLGKALLSEFLKGASPGFLEEIDSGEVRDYLAAEEQKLGLTHAQVGYELARTWSLPEAMQQVILHHHQPDAAAEEYRALVYAVHLGDIIAMMGGMGTGSDSLQYRLDPGHRDYFDLAPEDLAAIMLEVQDEFAKIAAAML
ncbi:HDOD domain-containing protein, partial [Desulfuromonas sp.]